MESEAYAGGEVGEAKEEQGKGCGEVHYWLVLGCCWVLYVCRWCGAPKCCRVVCGSESGEWLRICCCC